MKPKAASIKKYNLIVPALTIIGGLALYVALPFADFLFFNGSKPELTEIILFKNRTDTKLIIGLYFVALIATGFLVSGLLKSNRELKRLLFFSTGTLKALKKINQTILFESDLKILVEKSCDIITETGGFNIVWFIDSKGELIAWNDSSSYGKIDEIRQFLSGQALPKCINEAYRNKKMVVKAKNNEQCLDCNIDNYCSGYTLAAVPLIFNENIFGILCAVTDLEVWDNEDGYRLLETVANGLALAIHSIGSESYKKEMERKWTQLVETTNDGVISADREGIVTGWNPGAEKITGYKEDEILGKSIEKIEIPGDRKKHSEYFSNAFRLKSTSLYETSIKTKSDDIIPVEVSITFEEDSFGNLKEIAGILRDITERKKTEKILTETRERLELAMDTGDHGFWDWDLLKNRIYFSPGFFSMLDYSQDELPMEIDTWFNLIHPDDKKNVIPTINNFISQARHYNLEFRMLGKFGGWKWISSRVKTFEKDRNDVPSRVIGVHIDITERKKSEKNLREINERFNLVIKSTNAGLWDWNVQTGEAFFNERWAEIAGYSLSELYPLGINTWLDLCHPDDSKIANREMKKHFNNESDLYSCQVRVRHKNGDWVWIQSSGKVVLRDKIGNPIRVVGTNVDITEKKHEEFEREKLQQKLRETQKMEAVRKLAGGIAYDFNNLLQIIQGYSDLLMDLTENGSTEFEFLKEISNGAVKASELTSHLLAFSRQQVLEKRVFELNSTIKEMMETISRTLGDNIFFDNSLCHERLFIKADKSQIEQAILNLCSNSAEAMKNEGEISLKTDFINIKKGSEAVRDIEPGSYALISVEDSGCGIGKDEIIHIFEPFYTTKKKASGLGLSTVYGIIKQHRGHIQVQSEKKLGTKVKLFLPITDQVHPEQEKQENNTLPMGNGTVLIAEDDEALSLLIGKIIRRAGYNTILARNGFEAIEKGKEMIDEISLLFLDVLMPEKNGQQVYKELSDIKPGIPVIFSSGYNSDSSHTFFLEDKNHLFIQKPFKSDTLIKKINRLLHHSPVS